MSAFDADIDAAADEAGVPRVIFRRLIGTESGGDPLAVSPKGARGLAQLMPDTAADLERRYGLDTGNPKDNLRAGARYLREQYDAFGGDWRLALNAYNFGPGNLRAHLKAGGTADDLPAETRGHEQSVLGPRQAHRFDPLGREAMPRGATPLDLAISMQTFETPFWEQQGAHLRLGFGYSLPGQFLVENAFGSEGKRPGYWEALRRDWELPAKAGDDAFLDEKAWRASPWYREGLEWDT